MRPFNGNSIGLTTANNGSLTVNVGDQARFVKMSQGSVSDTLAGNTILARGTKGANGEMAGQTIRMGGRAGNRQGTAGLRRGGTSSGAQGTAGRGASGRLLQSRPYRL
jgi:hypothetical protein